MRRLADEPNTNRRGLAALNELLGANYLLASDLSSMPVLMKYRAGKLDAEAADRAIAAARTRVLEILKPGSQAALAEPPPRESLTALPENFAMEVLARRLDHIEHAAHKVARLAERQAIEAI